MRTRSTLFGIRLPVRFIRTTISHIGSRISGYRGGPRGTI